MIFVEALGKGVRLGEYVVRGRVWRGRFPEERNVEVLLCGGGGCRAVARAKVFHGRPPYYRRWIEVYSVDPRLPSMVEDLLLDLASASLGGGERLFYEYSWDPVTVRELELGVHPALTRLGYKMLVRGFTWFKDWYFPEGFMEGSQKLQGEKPVDSGACRRHLGEIAVEAARLAARPPEGAPWAAWRARGLLALLGEGVEGGPCRLLDVG